VVRAAMQEIAKSRIACHHAARSGTVDRRYR
jgi:hypothetical protein